MGTDELPHKKQKFLGETDIMANVGYQSWILSNLKPLINTQYDNTNIHPPVINVRDIPVNKGLRNGIIMEPNRGVSIAMFDERRIYIYTEHTHN